MSVVWLNTTPSLMHSVELSFAVLEWKVITFRIYDANSLWQVSKGKWRKRMRSRWAKHALKSLILQIDSHLCVTRHVPRIASSRPESRVQRKTQELGSKTKRTADEIKVRVVRSKGRRLLVEAIESELRAKRQYHDWTGESEESLRTESAVFAVESFVAQASAVAQTLAVSSAVRRTLAMLTPISVKADVADARRVLATSIRATV